jgi:putative two-component system response regulator
MHDVGKIAIPDSILLKPGALTREERAEIEEHAERGERILEASSSELMKLAAEIAGSQALSREGWAAVG